MLRNQKTESATGDLGLALEDGDEHCVGEFEPARDPQKPLNVLDVHGAGSRTFYMSCQSLSLGLFSHLQSGWHIAGAQEIFT